MKRLFLPVYLFLIGLMAVAQTPAPTLSTADKIALEACEKQKQAAQQQFQAAQQQELAVEREWQAAHPGFHLDPATLAVVADAAAKKDAPK